MAYLEQAAADYPSFVSLSQRGKTHEGRKIMMIKIGNDPEAKETRAVWIDAGIHAREWIAPSTALYVIDNLIKEFNAGNTNDLTKVGSNKKRPIHRYLYTTATRLLFSSC